VFGFVRGNHSENGGVDMESEIRDKTGEFARFTINLCINQFKALAACWDDFVAEASG
jgi:hypothetical protein